MENRPNKTAKRNKIHRERKINLLQGGGKQFEKRQSLLEKGPEQPKREVSLLHDKLEQFTKRKRLLEKGLKRIAKMQNLSQN